MTPFFKKQTVSGDGSVCSR